MPSFFQCNDTVFLKYKIKKLSTVYSKPQDMRMIYEIKYNKGRKDIFYSVVLKNVYKENSIFI